MRRADADVYYQNCAEYVTGQVALWCRRNGRKFVYSVATESHCDFRLPEMHTIRERVLYRYGLRHADCVIVQTHEQQRMLSSGFELASTVIPMPCPGPGADEYQLPELGDVHRVLWIGRICEEKRPDRLLELAEACPELTFDFVGPASERGYSRQMYDRAQCIPNVNVHGPASREQVPGFYMRATVLCCTSDIEGFPNTFVEAWSHGLPIVSTFDPDDLIANRKLGMVAEDVPGLAKGLRGLLGSAELWRQASENARRYYIENHTTETVMPEFEQVFQGVLRNDT